MNSSITWVEYGALGISIFMALIAILTTLITLWVFKSNNDPEIIVYPEIDKDEPEFINLVIHNIGKGPAKNIIFLPDRELPEKAFGDKLPEKMANGPIITGIPFLAPGAKRFVLWGQYLPLHQWFGGGEITLNARYQRASKFPIFKSKLESASILDVVSFSQTRSAVKPLVKIAKSLDTLNKTVERMKN
ncbi:hypothetical protein [Pseudoalteromonas luteoviolacea]|uniref:hypothetical protein n=1 Tax=Pseudoalteromonas luteoviolacea TaxID=43657 RepID=UPI001B396730|nr:hypothetical protein [Pseudoalteromonas luteoviolacea]MBQ4840041.1 hypothetical protein [Pseudoalteromonas luteoviolacea]